MGRIFGTLGNAVDVTVAGAASHHAAVGQTAWPESQLAETSFNLGTEVVIVDVGMQSINRTHGSGTAHAARHVSQGHSQRHFTVEGIYACLKYTLPNCAGGSVTVVRLLPHARRCRYATCASSSCRTQTPPPGNYRKSKPSKHYSH